MRYCFYFSTAEFSSSVWQAAYQVDDTGKTPLHTAAERGLCLIASHILTAASTAPPPDAGGEDEGKPGDELLVSMKDKVGDTALHSFARGQQLAGDMVALLVGKKADLGAVNKAKQTPLHLAALHAGPAAVAALRAAYPTAEKEVDQRGRTPLELAQARGLPGVIEALGGSCDPTAQGPKPTIVYHHPLCAEHHTCPAPITRSSEDPPPENVVRLQVPTHDPV